MLATTQPQEYLHTALNALRNGSDWQAVLDELPVPVYVADAEGSVTYWNQACVDFAGREPQLGRDKWCVTWELYTMTGERLPHEDCPMAEAIKERREIRGEVAIALRPDGSRRAFLPYPTPFFDSDGELSGAVNLLIDVTNEQTSALSDQAARCRRLARSTHDRDASAILASMAKDFAATAAALREER
jgi:PAS domain S-box-containing protein